MMLHSELNRRGRCDGETGFSASNRKRHRSESPEQDNGRLQRLETRMNELEAEVTFLRGVIAKRERICLVTTCKKTFNSNKVYAHIRKATDPAHQRAAAAFEFWCLRCSIPFSRECDLNRHLTVSHSKKKPFHETTDFYNQKSTPQSKLPSKSIFKAIPATAHNGLPADAPTGKAEPEKESEEDRHKEEEEQEESITDSCNNPETDSPGSQSEYRTAICATRQADSVYGKAPKHYGNSREGDKSALKAMQGVFSINKSNSIPGEQLMTNPQLAQYGTKPTSVDVPAGGSRSVLEGHHRANFYLSQNRTGPNSVEVPALSKSREFSNPVMMTNWYANPPTSDWQDLQNPAMMTNWYENPPTSDWHDLQNPAMMNNWCQNPQTGFKEHAEDV